MLLPKKEFSEAGSVAITSSCVAFAEPNPAVYMRIPASFSLCAMQMG